MEQTTVMSARLTLSPTRKVRVFRCWFSTVRALFTSSLACSVAWTDTNKQMTMQHYTVLRAYYIVKHRVTTSGWCTLADWRPTGIHFPPQLPNNHLSLMPGQKMLSCVPACWTAWFPEWGRPMRWLEGWSLSQRSSPTAAPGLRPGEWHHAEHHCSL